MRELRLSNAQDGAKRDEETPVRKSLIAGVFIVGDSPFRRRWNFHKDHLATILTRVNLSFTCIDEFDASVRPKFSHRETRGKCLKMSP